MTYEQLKEELFWEIQPLFVKYGITSDCIHLEDLIMKARDLGYNECESDNDY